MKKIFILIFFLLFSIPCFSQELYQYGVKAEIFENNTVSYKMTLIFANHPDQNFILSIGSPNNVNIESTTDCKVQPGTLETNIICDMKASNRTTVIVKYDSNQKVNRKDNYFLFTDSFKINADTDIIPILVRLPEGTGLRSPVENSYSPGNALIGSDGRSTIINWEMKNLKKGDRVDVSIAYERIGNIVISQIPIQVLLIIVVLVIAASVIFYKFYFRKKNVEIILPILKKDEKKIFDIILKHGDGVHQKTIVTDSGYSKAKVSKVLKSLEERRVLKLERIGRKNKVHIDKNFQNK